MEYLVIKNFTDKEDKHKYTVGDRYPYRGFAKKDRAEELSTANNKRGIPLIALKAESVEENKSEEKKPAKAKRSSKK